MLTSVSSSPVLHAQAVKYENLFSPGRTYGVLNGDLLALYINDRGDMGTPFRKGQVPEKPRGIIDPHTGRPTVNADGSIPGTSGTYAALFSDKSTAGLPTIGDSIGAKSEYITGGLTTVTEGFSVIGDDPNLQIAGRWLHGETLDSNLRYDPAAPNNPATNDFYVTNGSPTSELRAVTKLQHDLSSDFGTGAQLKITQDVTFQQDPTFKNRVKFQITFQNTSSVKALDNVRYARAFNPNQGAFSASGSSFKATKQVFRTPAWPSAFAIDSVFTDTDGITRRMGFGVLPGDSNSAGTILLSTPTTLEGLLLDNPDQQVGSAGHIGNNYVQLGSDADAGYFDQNGNEVASTQDYVTDDAFANTVEFDSNSTDNALLLLSPFMDIAPDSFQTFTFYYFFNPIGSTIIPEPGALSLFLSGLVSGGLLLRRRFRNR
jgi:hypothetical protein